MRMEDGLTVADNEFTVRIDGPATHATFFLSEPYASKVWVFTAEQWGMCHRHPRLSTPPPVESAPPHQEADLHTFLQSLPADLTFAGKIVAAVLFYRDHRSLPSVRWRELRVLFKKAGWPEP